ncbi:dipeptidase PepE [Kribbella speibonae]|uniref:dipeptidase E n=1 Tax=Kribbella speibonae TaxID=1572660 RepID=A0A4R0INI5_9ACTN|nr:dipeptidase PepE [Kribbella speibonae]TCC21712.1 dipeptidase PepE [Kribbella speibonae]TCC34000.1 dipeptidase PepE [Kribbella speibonae]
MELLLLSNSATHGRPFLEHALDALRDILRDVRELVFVPYALADHDGYTAKIRTALEPLGVSVVGAHTDAGALESAAAIFVGGGNTFRLVKTLQVSGQLDVIRDRVRNGTPYLGSSAGTNLAGPSLRTSNDMPIVQPPSFETLGLVPFQLNPHYLDPDPTSTHQGETRELRITEFLEENDVPVLGLREGTWLRRHADTLTLGGIAAGARLFRRGADPEEIASGSDLSELLKVTASYDA